MPTIYEMDTEIGALREALLRAVGLLRERDATITCLWEELDRVGHEHIRVGRIRELVAQHTLPAKPTAL